MPCAVLAAAVATSSLRATAVVRKAINHQKTRVGLEAATSAPPGPTSLRVVTLCASPASDLHFVTVEVVVHPLFELGRR